MRARDRDATRYRVARARDSPSSIHLRCGGAVLTPLRAELFRACLRSARDVGFSALVSPARDYSRDMLNRNPLLVGAAALLAGAAFGLSLPETEAENQYLGEGLVERAQNLGQ